MVDLRSYLRFVDINCTHLRVPWLWRCVSTCICDLFIRLQLYCEQGSTGAPQHSVIVEHQFVK